MKTSTIDSSIINGYLGLLENLSPSSKLELISKLTGLMKNDFQKDTSAFQKAFGALESDESAEEIIEKIQNSRVSTREN